MRDIARFAVRSDGSGEYVAMAPYHPVASDTIHLPGGPPLPLEVEGYVRLIIGGRT